MYKEIVAKTLFAISSIVVIGGGSTVGYYTYKTYHPTNSVAQIASANPSTSASASPANLVATSTPQSTAQSIQATAPAAATAAPAATATPTAATKQAAQAAIDTTNTINLTDVQATLTDLNTSLSVFSQ